MRRAISWVAILALPVVLVLGSPAANAQKKKDADKDKDSTDAVKVDRNSEKTIRMGVLVGKVTNVYEDKRRLNLQITIPYTRINEGAVNGLAQAQVQMAQARMNRDANAMLQAQIQMAQHQRNLYTTETRTETVEVEATDSVVVRTAKPKAQFDEKGKVKRLTRAELKELKGDPKLPGYQAEWGDITSDAIVQVTLVRKKTTGAPVKPVVTKRRKGKDKDGEDAAAAAADLLGKDTPQVSQIMILVDPSAK